MVIAGNWNIGWADSCRGDSWKVIWFAKYSWGRIWCFFVVLKAGEGAYIFIFNQLLTSTTIWLNNLFLHSSTFFPSAWIRVTSAYRIIVYNINNIRPRIEPCRSIFQHLASVGYLPIYFVLWHLFPGQDLRHLSSTPRIAYIYMYLNFFYVSHLSSTIM